MIYAPLVLLLLAMGNSAYARSTYAVFVPKNIRIGIPFSIDVEILPNNARDVDVEATLTPAPRRLNAAAFTFKSIKTSTVPSGGTKTIEFDPIPFGRVVGVSHFQVRVVGRKARTNEVIFDRTTTAIQFQKKFISIFIQTDKAIYQPGQTIKFRGVITTPDLRPYNGLTNFKLQDPKRNIIMRERNATLTQGVHGAEFKLGRYATLGSWIITYEVHGYQQAITVSVEEYKLPKFSVEIKTDQAFLHPGSKALTGELKAIYTFGQPVKGSAYIEVTISGRRPSPKIRIEISEFDGSENFEISAAKIRSILGWHPNTRTSPIKLFASVTEKNTGEQFNETKSVRLEQVKMKVEALTKPEHIKPGLPYTAYLKASQQDGSDLSPQELSKLQLYILISYKFAYNDPWRWWSRPRGPTVNKQQTLTVGAGGYIVFNLESATGDWQSVEFRVRSMTNRNRDLTSWTAERFESPTNTFLQVTTNASALNVGDTAKVTITTTQVPETTVYRISIVARGRIVKNELFVPQQYIKTASYQSFEYQFFVESHYAPSVYVLVSFVTKGGEFVADTFKIDIQAKLDNEVTMTTSTAKTDAGMPVSITVSADPGSFVGLRAIDQSVLLLKSGNDITRDKIFGDLDRYGITGNGGGRFRPWGRWWWPWPVGGGNVKEVFDNSGFIVLTDGVLQPPPQRPIWSFWRGGPEFSRRAIGGFQFQPLSAPSPVRPLQSPRSLPAKKPDQGRANNGAEVKTRSFFPESWIWSEKFIRLDGSVTFNYNTPDTITTWELSSFAVSSTKGLGVTAQNSKITVFRSFFISLNLPPSIVRGEILNMKTTLFNYFDFTVFVKLTLDENEWYDLIIPTGVSVEVAGAVRSVVVPSKDSVTVVFPIKFKKVGRSKISVKATTGVAADAVERTLLVKPEGVPKVVSHSRIISRDSNTLPASVISFDVDIPSDAVEGSAYVKCSVSGNILGSSLSNIGNLLRLPRGCGEQTMLNFAPAVFVSKFLKESGQLTGQFKQKSENYIREGYQNELRYQRQDGSFSAFGSRDAAGSTWLTAFVIKCFIAANDLNPDLIEESKIRRAVAFLLKQQSKDGTFKEPGRIIHQSMQGGVDSMETTAAYMLIALTEGNMYGPNSKDNVVKTAIAKSRKYLESKVDSIDDLYTLSIASYALALLQSQKAGSVLARLDAKATVESNVKFWQKEESGAAKCDAAERYCPFDNKKSSSSSIESTSYILLTYLKMGRINEVMPIVRWLVQQRGASGGYHSTQDTVMAIQALATVAGHFSSQKLNMTVNIAHDGKPDFGTTFKLSQDNAIVLQMAELPGLDGTVTASATGTGVGDVQFTVGYHLPAGPRADEPFVIDVDVKELPNQRVELHICSRINENRTEIVNKTGMYVVTFTLPTGYTIDQGEATNDNPQAKLVEVVGEEVTGYFDELPKGKTVCLDVMLIQYAEVAGVKPQLVIAYDYYKPEIQAMRQIALKSDEDICTVCGSACAGCKDAL